VFLDRSRAAGSGGVSFIRLLSISPQGCPNNRGHFVLASFQILIPNNSRHVVCVEMSLSVLPLRAFASVDNWQSATINEAGFPVRTKAAMRKLGYDKPSRNQCRADLIIDQSGPLIVG